MRPVLLRVGGRNVYAYATFLYLGLVAGVYGGAAAAASAGLDPADFTLATLVLIGPALAGARVWFVLGNRDAFRGDWKRVAARWQGGAAMYGGFLIGVPLSIPLLRALDLPFGAYWDAASVTLMAGMALTRVGCLLNGCCAGRATERWFGLVLPAHGSVRCRRAPTQILEGASALLLLALIVALRPHEPFAGAVFLLTIAGYGASRVALEPLRERGREGNRVTSLAFVAVALAALVAAWLW
ncbi:MAG: phosphatidylglycerol---prolipoprotein diacylglyceryl transferase [Gaiellaceae bacterium]|jgi:prolipoprotein diacylglyceryltransferase|nr:phosphatidylglycerol---prolipoprotein diacylglyceryl transferase [Gaiellaceae bacterium]